MVDECGKHRCAACAADVISTDIAAREAADRVLSRVRRFSVWIDLRVPCELASAGRIAEFGGGDSTLGVTARTKIVQGRKVKMTAKILIRRGLPSLVFESTLAHELVHVAVLEAGWTGLPARTEEGLAQYVAWRYLTDFAGDRTLGRRWARSIARHSSPLYGEGFRLVSGLIEREGFESVWREIRHGVDPFAQPEHFFRVRS